MDDHRGKNGCRETGLEVKAGWRDESYSSVSNSLKGDVFHRYARGSHGLWNKKVLRCSTDCCT